MNKLIALFARLSGGAVILEKIAKYRTHLIKAAAILAIIGAACTYSAGAIGKLASCPTLSCVVDVVRSIPDDIKDLAK